MFGVLKIIIIKNLLGVQEIRFIIIFLHLAIFVFMFCQHENKLVHNQRKMEKWKMKNNICIKYDNFSCFKFLEFSLYPFAKYIRNTNNEYTDSICSVAWL